MCLRGGGRKGGKKKRKRGVKKKADFPLLLPLMREKKKREKGEIPEKGEKKKRPGPVLRVFQGLSAKKGKEGKRLRVCRSTLVREKVSIEVEEKWEITM